MTGTQALAERLHSAGFTPDFNVCASCGHHGGQHDLGNWCLLCPRPAMDARPIDARLAAGWCYFGSMTETEKWDHGLAAILADGSAYLTPAEAVRVAAIEEAARDVDNLVPVFPESGRWSPDAIDALATLRTALESKP
jgi:hypothetical protein